MKKEKLPNKKFLVFAKNTVKGYGGLDNLVFSFDDETSGLGELKTFVKKNQLIYDDFSYQILAIETNELIHFRHFKEFEDYLNQKINENKILLIVKQKEQKMV